MIYVIKLIISWQFFPSVGVPATGPIPHNSVSGPGSLQQQLPGHGTSAGFCNICHKFVSNRTNHKYVHSQVLPKNFVPRLFSVEWVAVCSLYIYL